MRRGRARQEGTAIFMALLIIAIVAGMTILLMRAQQIDVRRTQMMFTSEQALLYAQGVVDWAKGALITDLRNNNPQTVWPLVLPPTTIADGQGKISGILQDAQGLFNLNNFQPQQNNSLPQNSPAFKLAQSIPNIPVNQAIPATTGGGQQNNTILFNLLNVLGIQLPAGQQQLINNAITDWVSMPNNTSGTIPLTSFDNYYQQLNPSYRSPHALMGCASELRIIQGVTPLMYQGLLPYIVALPTNSTTINVQHAPLALQKAMGVNPQAAQTAQTAQPSQTGSTAQAGSQYFLLRADVFLADQHLVLYSLLQRGISTTNPNAINVSMLWQSLGTEC